MFYGMQFRAFLRFSMPSSRKILLKRCTVRKCRIYDVR